MKFDTPGNPRKSLWSVLHGTPLPVISLYWRYASLQCTIHWRNRTRFSSRLHCCAFFFRLVQNEQRKMDVLGVVKAISYPGQTGGDLNDNPNNASIVTSLFCCLNSSISLNKTVSQVGAKYCRLLYSLAVCRQLSVTDSIPQNCLQITMNILDFSKYATVHLHHLGTSIPDMYV